MPDLDEALLVGTATEQQRAVLVASLEIGLAFMSGAARGGKVIDYVSEDELRRILALPLPHGGLPMNDLLEEVRQTVVRCSVAQSDPRYLAFPDTGNSVAGLAADVLSAFLNQNLIAFDRSAPTGTFVEMQLIQWLRQLVGYSHVPIDKPNLTLADVGGLWTSGGNMSNHVAVLTALHAKFPEVKEQGLRGLKKRPVIVLAKGIEHFSFASAALSLGLGQDSLVWCDPGRDFRTDIGALRHVLGSLGKDDEPFMVVSVAGNCRTTSIDDIPEMREICDEHGIWLHVDACHGGNLLFSEALKGRLKGIEKAESVSLDPHKGLFVGYPCSYVLFRDSRALKYICRYPEKFSDPTCLDLGLIMPFYGSRGFHSLKLWMLIRHLGIAGIGALIERRQEVNDRLVRRLRNCGIFALLSQGEYYRTAFVFYPDVVREHVNLTNLQKQAPESLHTLIDSYTRRFSDMLYRAGEVVFDLFTLCDFDDIIGLGTKRKYATMAMAVGHPYLSTATEDAIFEEIATQAVMLTAEMLRDAGVLHDEAPRIAQVSSKGPAGW